MLTITTTNAATLLDAFDKAIASGGVKTWVKDGDGDYKHIAQDWAGKAWMRPVSKTGSSLQFRILISENVKTTADRRAVYSYYHARLAETFSRDFSAHCSAANFTTSPTLNDSKI